jgi:hypothetical protein
VKKEASRVFLIKAHHGAGQKKGLISDRLTVVDSTRVGAKVDTFKIKDIIGASPDKDVHHGLMVRFEQCLSRGNFTPA